MSQVDVLNSTQTAPEGPRGPLSSPQPPAPPVLSTPHDSLIPPREDSTATLTRPPRPDTLKDAAAALLPVVETYRDSRLDRTVRFLQRPPGKLPKVEKVRLPANHIAQPPAPIIAPPLESTDVFMADVGGGCEDEEMSEMQSGTGANGPSSGAEANEGALSAF